MSYKKIPVADGHYEISQGGTVRRIDSGKIIKPKLERGYRCYNLWGKNSKRITQAEHRLILLAHVGPCPKGYHGAHLDGNKLNNSLNNLAWVSAKENEAHKKIHGTACVGEKHWMHKITYQDVMKIKRTIKETIEGLSKEMNISATQISDILRGKAWKSVPEFIDKALGKESE